MVRFTALASVCAVALAVYAPGAHANAEPSPRFVFEKRQASSSSHSGRHSSATATASAAASTTAAAPTSAPSASGSITASVLQALSTITSGTANAEPTQPLPTTFRAGSTNTYISNAPPLPDISRIDPQQYPDLDVLPSKSTRAAVLAQNQQWLSSVDFSSVPKIAQTKDGSCASDPQLAAAASQNGWWTCGGYTRSTDVTTCPQTNQWGLSYDDGPSPYTPQLLNYMQQHSLKATFFLVGSRVISRPEMVQTEYMLGNQLAVHTWSHPSLTTLSNEDIYLELKWTQKVIEDVTGVTPLTMRPPYGDIDDRVRAVCKLLNLTPIIWTSANGETYDTEDWQIGSGQVTALQAYTNFANILKTAPSLSTGYIVLAHDLYQQSVDLATKAVLPQALTIQPKQNLMPIVQCLNQRPGDAYSQTNRNISGLSPASTASGSAASSPTSSTSGSGNSGNNTGAAAAQSVPLVGAAAMAAAAVVGAIAVVAL